MNISTRARFLVLGVSLAWSVGAWAQPPQTQQAVLNSSFEDVGVPVRAAPAEHKAKITGQIARYWNDNSSWADVDIHYSLDTTNPHSGQNAQKIEVTRIGSGVAHFVQEMQFFKNRIYRFTVWLKGTPGQSVQLVLRQKRAPFNDYASKSASLNAEWHAFQVGGQIPENAEGYVMLRTSAPMSYWVDDAQFEDVTGATANLESKVRGKGAW